MKFLAVAALLLSGTGCVCLSLAGPFTCDGAYTNTKWEGNEMVRFPWHQTGTTAKGVKLDETAGVLKVDVDAVVDRVAKCLGVSAKHCGLRVKVAPGWESGIVSGAQSFPCHGMTCTGALQYPATAVVPPEADALAHELVHILTNDPGHGPEMARCGK